jgi:two-component system response regulator HydG
MKRILVIDDDPTFCTMLKTFLTNKGFSVKEAFSAAESLKAIRLEQFDIALSDFRLPDKDGLELLKDIRQLKPKLPVIIMTRYADIRVAIRAIKMGAYEYVTKPINPDEILAAIRGALEKAEEESDVSSNQGSQKNNFHYVSGASKTSSKVERYIDLVAPTSMSVIIQGESGTGKEYVARMIHQKSKRSDNPFMAVDCGALSKELAGSELFGHVKGSFTDAINDKQGQFELSNGGTLFLDEIGNLPYETQLKLLRATQERRIRKIGGNKDIPVDVRIIVATNEDLSDAVKKGTFREDLYHRLNEFKIDVPPLRERHNDIRVFASHFLELANEELGKTVQNFSQDVVDLMHVYSWPGNIREMKNVIKRAVLLATDEQITLECLPAEIVSTSSEPETAYPITTDLKVIAEQNERTVIISTLEKVHYNKSKAARMLNIDRKTLYNKLRQYGIDG